MLPLMPKRTICIPDEGGWRRRAGLTSTALRPCSSRSEVEHGPMSLIWLKLPNPRLELLH